MNKRINWIDSIKFFLIILVTWGHFIQVTSANNFFFNPVFKLIYTFHMPLFMMISGYLFYNYLTKDVTHLIKDKITPLLLIVFSWEICCLIIRLILVKFQIDDSKFLINDAIFMFRNRLWYVWALALSTIITTLIYNSYRFKLLPYILTAIFLFFVQDNQTNIFLYFMFPYFIAGVFIKHFSIIDKIKIKHLFLLILLFVILYINFDGDYYIYQNIRSVKIILIRFLIGFVGSIFFIAIFSKFSILSKNNKLVTYISKNTLVIYILNAYLMKYIPKLKIPYINFYVYNFLTTTVLTIIFITFCLLVAYILNKSKLTKKLFLVS